MRGEEEAGNDSAGTPIFIASAGDPRMMVKQSSGPQGAFRAAAVVMTCFILPGSVGPACRSYVRARTVGKVNRA